jgi:predicted transcriptional regulator
MAKKSTTSVGSTALIEPEEDMMIFEEDGGFRPARSSATPIEEVHTKVKEAHEELLQLKLRQEEIERTKNELEIISQKQARFAYGKRDVLEKMSRATVNIERELYASQKLVEELASTHDAYARHLEVLKALQPEKWQRADVLEELDSALAAVDDAENDYLKSTRRLQSLRPEPETIESTQAAAPSLAGAAPAEPESMKDLMRRGFALSAPLIASLLALLLIARALF